MSVYSLSLSFSFLFHDDARRIQQLRLNLNQKCFFSLYCHLLCIIANYYAIKPCQHVLRKFKKTFLTFFFIFMESHGLYRFNHVLDVQITQAFTKFVFFLFCFFAKIPNRKALDKSNILIIVLCLPFPFTLNVIFVISEIVPKHIFLLFFSHFKVEVIFLFFAYLL